jgi:hypothetical protein
MILWGHAGGRDHAESPGSDGASPYLRLTIDRHIFVSGIFSLAMLSQSRQPGKSVSGETPLTPPTSSIVLVLVIVIVIVIVLDL